MQDQTKLLSSYVVLVILVSIGIWMFVGAVQKHHTLNSSNDDELTSVLKDDWITYTNTDYGYEISFPPAVEFTGSSETTLASQEIPGKKDQLVFIGSRHEDSIYIISAGAALKDYSATNSELLLLNFNEQTIPNQISGRMGREYALSTSDYTIKELMHNDSPAIEVRNPAGFRIETANTQGDIFVVTATEYSGDITTPKARLTREIIDTFRVLKPADD